MEHPKRYFILSTLILLFLAYGCHKTTFGPFPNQRIDLIFNAHDTVIEQCYLEEGLVELWQSKDTLIVTGHHNNKEAFRFQCRYDSITMPDKTRYTLISMVNGPQNTTLIPGEVRIDFSAWKYPYGVAYLQDHDYLNFSVERKNELFVCRFQGYITLDQRSISIAGTFYGKRRFR